MTRFLNELHSKSFLFIDKFSYTHGCYTQEIVSTHDWTSSVSFTYISHSLCIFNNSKPFYRRITGTLRNLDCKTSSATKTNVKQTSKSNKLILKQELKTAEKRKRNLWSYIVNTGFLVFAAVKNWRQRTEQCSERLSMYQWRSTRLSSNNELCKASHDSSGPSAVLASAVNFLLHYVLTPAGRLPTSLPSPLITLSATNCPYSLPLPPSPLLLFLFLPFLLSFSIDSISRFLLVVPLAFSYLSVPSPISTRPGVAPKVTAQPAVSEILCRGS